MRIYGNLMNRLSECVKSTPTVGVGATIFHYSDREPGTVVKVSPSGKTAWVQVDDAERTDNNGMSEAQQWAFKPNTSAPVHKASLRKDGTWKLRGRTGSGVSFGSRSKYYDFGF